MIMTPNHLFAIFLFPRNDQGPAQLKEKDLVRGGQKRRTPKNSGHGPTPKTRLGLEISISALFIDIEN